MAKKRVYYYDLSQDQSSQIERIEVFSCEDYSSYCLNVYFRLSSSKTGFYIFCLTKPKVSVTNLCQDTSNKPAPRTAEHYEKVHVIHEKTHLAHSHIYFDSPITLSNLREYFHKLDNECCSVDRRLKGCSAQTMLSMSILDPVMALYASHFISHGELQEFFFKKNAIQAFISSYEKYLQAELFRACALGDIDEIKYLLKLGVSVNCQDEAGRTPLHCAVMRSGLISKYDQTIEVAACMANHPAVVKMLLCDYSANPEIQNNSGNTVAMLIAREKGSADQLDRETALAIEKSLEAALFQACALGDLRQVKMLLDLGVSVNCKDELGRTPLHYAVMRSDLIETKYADEIRKASITIESAMARHPDVVRMLLEDYNADQTIQNSNNKTPFDLIQRDKNSDNPLTRETAQAISAIWPAVMEREQAEVVVPPAVRAHAQEEAAAQDRERRGEYIRVKYLARLSRAAFFPESVVKPKGDSLELQG